jgi:hypothetical protein
MPGRLALARIMTLEIDSLRPVLTARWLRRQTRGITHDELDLTLPYLHSMPVTPHESIIFEELVGIDERSEKL